jgi:hypothetical protein
MPNQQAPIWKVLQPTKPKIELNEINDLLLANVGGHLHHPPFAVVMNLVLSVSQSYIPLTLHYITSPRMEIDGAFQGHRYHNYRYKIVEESFLGILRFICHEGVSYLISKGRILCQTEEDLNACLR